MYREIWRKKKYISFSIIIRIRIDGFAALARLLSYWCSVFAVYLSKFPIFRELLLILIFLSCWMLNVHSFCFVFFSFAELPNLSNSSAHWIRILFHFLISNSHFDLVALFCCVPPFWLHSFLCCQFFFLYLCTLPAFIALIRWKCSSLEFHFRLLPVTECRAKWWNDSYL